MLNVVVRAICIAGAFVLLTSPASGAEAGQKGEVDIIVALIGLGGVVFGAVFTPLISSFLEKSELKRTKAEMEKLEAGYKQLSQNFRDLADRELFKTTSRRLISFQLLVVDSYLRDRKSSRSPTLEILGINALAPVHQGREMIRDILKLEEGQVRILLLDPYSEAFRGPNGRMSFEKDSVGRLVAELRATLSILADIRAQVGEAAFRNLELRLHSADPDRSLIMVDAGAASFDAATNAEAVVAAYSEGVILENPYSRRRGERGLEGESRRWTPKRGGGETNYQECVEYFRGLWLNARSIPVPVFPFNADFVPQPSAAVRASSAFPDATEVAPAPT